MTTKIEWVRSPDGSPGETWNAVTGCSKVSPGCANCYAERQALGRLKGSAGYPGLPWTQRNAVTNVVLHPERVFAPLRKQKPTTYFVNSMSDLFHERIPNEFIAAMFGVMAATPRHTFQILTKRPEAMETWFKWVRLQDATMAALCDGTPGRLEACWRALDHEREYHPKGDSGPLHMKHSANPVGPWPLPNVWLGVSVEDRARKCRIDVLRRSPAAVRFVSLEPLLEELGELELEGIDWVIVGGESGPDARPMHPAWPRAIRDKCAAVGVPFFFKQWGEWAPIPDHHVLDGDIGLRVSGRVNGYASIHGDAVTMRRLGKKDAGAELDGRTWLEMPKLGP